jgi:hypothetical protein
MDVLEMDGIFVNESSKDSSSNIPGVSVAISGIADSNLLDEMF